MMLIDLHQHTLAGIYHKIIRRYPDFFGQDIILIHSMHTSDRLSPYYVVKHLRKSFDMCHELAEESQLLGQFRMHSNARIFASAFIAARKDLTSDATRTNGTTGV